MPLHAQTKAERDVLLGVAERLGRGQTTQVSLMMPLELYNRLYAHTNGNPNKTLMMSAFCREAIISRLDREQSAPTQSDRDIHKIITDFQDAFPGTHLTLPEAEWLLDKLEKIA